MLCGKVNSLLDALGRVDPHISLQQVLPLCDAPVWLLVLFQETQIPSVHDIAALTFFVTGVTYIVLQSIISHRMYPYWSSRSVCLCQTFISAISVIAAVPSILCCLRHLKHLPSNSECRGVVWCEGSGYQGVWFVCYGRQKHLTWAETLWPICSVKTAAILNCTLQKSSS